MEHVKKDRALLIYVALLVMIAGAIVSAPFWAWGTTWRGQRLGIAQPAVGDVGWADINDRNHLITEIVNVPILDGHLVLSGATPTDGGGLGISWDAGIVVFSGVSYPLASGSTNLGNNDVNWVSAVTLEGSSGATVRVNTGEAYPPSAASGYYTPLAIAFTEAGDIARMGDLRYRPINHSAFHERAGDWEIDGDHLDIDLNPSYYTPSTTPSEADNADDLAAHLYGIDQKLNEKAEVDISQQWSADQGFSGVSASRLVSGASPANTVPDSGTSLEAKYFGTIVTHNQATSTIYGMPPISGASTTYVKFIEGAAAAGITIYNVNGEPFMGNGDSGVSYLALPPGNPFESATIYSVSLSGTCKYWFFEATSGWGAGN